MRNRYRTPELAVALLLVIFTTILLSCSSGDNVSTAGSGAPDALTAEKSTALYDLVIQNGRVIDPATGRDEIASVGIKNAEPWGIRPRNETNLSICYGSRPGTF